MHIKKNSAELKPETAKGFKIIDFLTQPGNWFVQDPELDQIEGVSSVRSVQQLNLTSPKEIMVAVLNSGVDIHHPALQDHIWTNPGESGLDPSGNNKEFNQIDDDQNRFIAGQTSKNFE